VTRAPQSAELGSHRGRSAAARGKEQVDLSLDLSAALARQSLEACIVPDGDRSPLLLEETRRLELLQDSRHGGTLDPDHLREEFVREGQGILAHPVSGAENPTAAPGFDAVDRIARDRIERLAYDELVDVPERPQHVGSINHDLIQIRHGDAGCATRELDDELANGRPGRRSRDDTYHRLSAECCHLDGLPVLHESDEGDDTVVRKVGMRNRVPRMVEDVAPLQVNGLKIWKQCREIIRRKRSEEEVCQVLAVGHDGLGAAPLASRRQTWPCRYIVLAKSFNTRAMGVLMRRSPTW